MLRIDIAVCEMMVALQAQFPARRDRLIQALRIDVNWRMYVKAGKVTYTRLEECNSFVAHQKAFHPEPLMKTVEEWLRAELADKKFALEKEGGALASLSAQDSAGGYANGRLVTTLLD